LYFVTLVFHFSGVFAFGIYFLKQLCSRKCVRRDITAPSENIEGRSVPVGGPKVPGGRNNNQNDDDESAGSASKASTRPNPKALQTTIGSQTGLDEESHRIAGIYLNQFPRIFYYLLAGKSQQLKSYRAVPSLKLNIYLTLGFRRNRCLEPMYLPFEVGITFSHSSIGSRNVIQRPRGCG